jgi:hypothetical protein
MRDVLEWIGVGGRLQRGRTYARNGQVIDQTAVEFSEKVDDLARRELVAWLTHAVTRSRAGTKTLTRAK